MQVGHSRSSRVAQLAQGLLSRAAQLLPSCQEAAQLCQVERVLRASIAACSKCSLHSPHSRAPINSLSDRMDHLPAHAACTDLHVAVRQRTQQCCPRRPPLPAHDAAIAMELRDI
jgi:hypothetical protein